MSRYPILPSSLYLTERTVLLVGEASADERASRLADSGATVRRIAGRDYQPDMCDGVFLVMAQTGERALDRRIAADARSRGALVYAHDQPDVSDFAMPAVAARGPLRIAIATSATAPGLARRLRQELDRLLTDAGAALDGLLDALDRERQAPRSPEREVRLVRLAERLRLTGRIEVEPY